MFDFITRASLIESAVILAVTVALSFAVKYLVKSLRKLNDKHFFFKTLGETLDPVAFWLVWLFGLLLTMEAFLSGSDCFIQYISYIMGKKLIALTLLTWLLLRWKQKLENNLLKKVKSSKTAANDTALITVGSKVVTILVLVIAGFMVLDILHVPVTALLAFGGIGSLAVSWAAKDVIANFFGGMMIFINHPFYVGDWIKSPNKGFEGIVEEIGWYMTRIRTFERRPTYLPNALLTDAIVENPGRMYNRRIKTTMGIRYEDINRVQAVVVDIEKMLRGHEQIDQNQLLFVHLVEFNDYSLDIEVYCFTKTIKWGEFRSVQQDVLLKIAAIIQENGAELAFPTQTLHLQKEKS